MLVHEAKYRNLWYSATVSFVQGIGLVSWHSFISAIHAAKERRVLLSYFRA